jgi:hypothetical protein
MADSVCGINYQPVSFGEKIRKGGRLKGENVKMEERGKEKEKMGSKRVK